MDTKGRGYIDRRNTGTGVWNSQNALLAHDQTEDREEDWVTPGWKRALNVCSQQGGKGKGSPTQQPTLPARIRGMEGDNLTRQQDPPACSQATDEEGTPDIAARASYVQPWDRVGHPGQAAVSPRAHPGYRGGREPPEHQHIIPAHVLQEKEGGAGDDQKGE